MSWKFALLFASIIILIGVGIFLQTQKQQEETTTQNVDRSLETLNIEIENSLNEVDQELTDLNNL